MNADDSFDFGHNVDRTACVSDPEIIAWRDIEAERRNARADVATVADSLWARAVRHVALIRQPALKLWAARWVAYCLTPGTKRPVRHAGEAGKACRRVELALADCGIVDPEGFTYGTEERAPRKRKFKGVFRGVAGQLEEYRDRMRGPWIG